MTLYVPSTIYRRKPDWFAWDKNKFLDFFGSSTENAGVNNVDILTHGWEE